MAKAKFTITQNWQQVATGAAVFTIEKVGEGTIFFNETEDDVTAYRDSGLAGGEQYQQTAAVITTVRADGDGWELIADGVL